ncbi:MAG: RHS repeat-associated core domain-containing protein [Phycisphaerae bacterium]
MRPATTQPAAGDLKSVYDYDYLGRRTRKRVFHWDPGSSDWASTPDLDRRFVYDGWNRVTEMDGLDTDESGSPAILRQFTWGLDLSGLNGGQSGGAWPGPGGVSNMGGTSDSGGTGHNLGGTGFQPVNDGALPAMHAAGGIGGLLAVLDWTLVTPQMSGLGQAYLYDGNGNVGQLLSLDDGSVVTAYEYDAYGNVTAETDGEYAPENPFRFSTKFHDDDTELVYYGHRFYRALAGRWQSCDLLEEFDHRNRYAFVQNSPVARIDRLGLATYKRMGPCYRYCASFFLYCASCETFFVVAPGENNACLNNLQGCLQNCNYGNSRTGYTPPNRLTLSCCKCTRPDVNGVLTCPGRTSGVGEIPRWLDVLLNTVGYQANWSESWSGLDALAGVGKLAACAGYSKWKKEHEGQPDFSDPDFMFHWITCRVQDKDGVDPPPPGFFR